MDTEKDFTNTTHCRTRRQDGGTLYIHDTPEGVRVLWTCTETLPKMTDLSWPDLAAIARGDWSPKPFMKFLRDLGRKMPPVGDVTITPINFQKMDFPPMGTPLPEPPHYKCLQCGRDYGVGLPFPELDPRCGCAEECDEYKNRSDGIVILEHHEHFPVWMVVALDEEGFSGTSFFKRDEAYKFADNFDDANVIELAMRSTEVINTDDVAMQVQSALQHWVNDAVMMKINQPL